MCYFAAASSKDTEVKKKPVSDLRAFILSEPFFLAGDACFVHVIILYCVKSWIDYILRPM